MVLPGPEAQQLATYIGWLMHRTWGGIVAGVLFVLPSLFILIALSWIYIAFGDVPLVAGLFYGIKPAVTAIVLQAAHRIGSRALKNNVLWAIAGGGLRRHLRLELPFPLIVPRGADSASSAADAPEKFGGGGGHGAPRQVIRPGADRRRHAAAGTCALQLAARWLRVLAVGALLWLLPMAC
jgi:chromate transporter